ncbi:ABC transporter substrate-binding protein [Actinomadura vinacea]|uniref:ABC transporter substrate-binding protein n=1 Tax=Actinomadura vinacea TaxID=115336 RepID=A0ABN3IRV7_9ACTN
MFNGFTRSTRSLAAPVTLLTLALSLAGCGGGESGGLSATAPLPTTVPAGTKIIFADQNEQDQTLLRASGELARMKTKVEYANFLGGPAILEAFRGDAVDLAVVADTPPIQAQAAGEDVPIIAARQERPYDYHLAIAPGANIRTLRDLKGKKIAYGEGTGRQPYVLRALKKAGLTKKDVTLVPLKAADFPDAVRNRQVDAAPLNEPHYTRYLTEYRSRGGSGLPEAETAGLATGLWFLYARRAALKDPAKAAGIAEYVRHWVRAQWWSSENADAWIDAYFVKNQRLSVADGQTIIRSQGGFSFPKLDQALIGRQQQTMDLLFEAGDLPKRLQAKEAIDTRFDAVVQAAARSAGADRGTASPQPSGGTGPSRSPAARPEGGGS